MHDLEINQNVLLLLMNSQILEDVQAGISFNVISTLCESSETLTEWKSESVMDNRQRTDGQTDGRTRVLETLVCLKILDYGGMLLIYI